MFTETFVDKSSIWLLYVLTVILLVAGSEMGFRFGRFSKAHWPESGKSSAGTITGSGLGLLAFLLAFTFGMSITRFDTRKELVLNEAVALLAAHQRAQSLPEPQREKCSRLLDEYVQDRLHIVDVTTMEEVRAMILRSEQIQDALWAEAVSMSEQPNAVLSGFMQSLSTLTELQIKRVRAAAWNRIPMIIVFTLYGIAFFAFSGLGFNSGLSNHRPTFPLAMLVLAFACVMVLIIDLERPRQQLFKVSQEPMLDVARRIHSGLPES